MFGNAVWDAENVNKTSTYEETVVQDYILILLSYYLVYTWVYRGIYWRRIDWKEGGRYGNVSLWEVALLSAGSCRKGQLIQRVIYAEIPVLPSNRERGTEIWESRDDKLTVYGMRIHFSGSRYIFILSRYLRSKYRNLFCYNIIYKAILVMNNNNLLAF